MFPDLREAALCRKNPLGPSIMLSSDHRASGPPMWAVYALLGVVRLTTVGVLIGRAHPPFWLAKRPCLVWWMLGPLHIR